MPKPFPFQRAEKRIPMEIAVVVSGNQQVPGVERTFTENVSARGARIISIRRWAQGDRVELVSPLGDFRSTGRVAYCQSRRGEGYAVGIEFLEAKGPWVVQVPARGSRKPN